MWSMGDSDGPIPWQEVHIPWVIQQRNRSCKAYDKAAIECNGREAVTNFEPSSYEGEMLPEPDSEAICSFHDARTTELVTAAYPALDELTSKAKNQYRLSGQEVKFKQLNIHVWEALRREEEAIGTARNLSFCEICKDVVDGGVVEVRKKLVKLGLEAAILSVITVFTEVVGKVGSTTWREEKREQKSMTSPPQTLLVSNVLINVVMSLEGLGEVDPAIGAPDAGISTKEMVEPTSGLEFSKRSGKESVGSTWDAEEWATPSSKSRAGDAAEE
ncbi:uncharacterized protein A4U43_C10F10590 [Asparagus officinalis]|uniref:AP2/ERF domain-containing protein n=1 Tax=Asparagus officinalis TaxID=4686 RepID=A0A5P1E1Z0_ASPOF|nr:uncharacterized protein A4U43_C10F10590 [Asparagus officinalis]